MKHKDSREPKDWLERSSHDLDAAKKLMDAGGFPDSIGFHCHQTVEKALKGMLLAQGVDYPFYP